MISQVVVGVVSLKKNNMAYQIPKKDHPWRQYNNREYKVVEEEQDKHKKSVKIFVREISQSWDTIEVFTYAYGREGKFTLSELSNSKQAAWLVGLLKRSYEQI